MGLRSFEVQGLKVVTLIVFFRVLRFRALGFGGSGLKDFSGCKIFL